MPDIFPESIYDAPEDVHSARLQSIYDNPNDVSRLAVSSKSGKTPEQAARILRLEASTGLPADLIESDIDNIERDSAAKNFDPVEYRNNNPKVSAWMATNINHQPLVKNDLGFLSQIEGAASSFGKGWETVKNQEKMAALLLKKREGVATKDDVNQIELLRNQSAIPSDESKTEYLARGAGYGWAQGLSSIKASGEGAIRGGIIGATIGHIVPGVTELAVGFPLAVYGAGAEVFEYTRNLETAFAWDQLDQMKDISGNPIVDKEVAKNVSAAVGVINGIIEVGGDYALTMLVPVAKNLVGGLGKKAAKEAVNSAVKKALTVPTVRGALLSAASNMVKAGSIEGVQEFIQNLVNVAGRETAQFVTAQFVSGQDFAPNDAVQDLTESAVQARDAFFSTVLGPGLFFGGVDMMESVSKARDAKISENFYKKLGEGVKESETFKNSPEKGEEVVAAAVKDSPYQNTYVTPDVWNSYWQSQNVDPREIAREVLGDTVQYDQAVSTGTDLIIPTERYARKIAPTEHNAALAQDLRFSPDAMSSREARQFFQSVSDRNKPGEVPLTEGVDTSNEVFQDISKQLKNTGKYSDAQIEQYATLWQSTFKNLAQRSRIDVAELYNRYKPTITQLDKPPVVGEGLYQESESLIPEVNKIENLVVMHNLTEDNLRHADKVGGLAVPSVAIGDVNNPLFNFGEITLIGSKELINPKISSNKVFNADIYSPRYPDIRYSLDSKKYQDLRKGLNNEEILLGRKLSDDLNAYDFNNKGLEALYNSPILQLKYLHLQGESFDIPEIKIDNHWTSLNKSIIEFLDSTDTVAELSKNKDFLIEYKKLSEYGDKDLSWYNEDGNPNYNIIKEIRYEIEALKEKGKPDFYTAKSTIEELIYRHIEDFHQWVDTNYSQLIGKEQIFSGKFKPDGDRKYIQHNLENVVRVMKYELQSGEGFNYGLGNVRASVAKKYRSIQEIQKDRSKILSEKEFEKVKEFTNNEFTAILDQAMEIYSLEKDYGIADRFTTVLVDGIKNGNFKAELSKYGFEKMDFGRIEAFLSTLKNMPTEYFEGKLQRAVKLNEFSGAIIPKNTSTKAIDILKANNIPFEFYDPEVPESRTQAINKINENSKILFQTGASVYRGRVRFKGQSSYNPTIELFKDANLSTFLHETGHVYFEIMKDLAKTNPQIQADLDTILKWQGLTDASQVKTEHHEAFARGFETYLMEGKAPSSGLRAVFARFKAWLMGIYKDFTRLNIQLTDEVRGVFDRLVASDEAIASAENQQNYEPLFIDPKTQGMTDAQAARYMEAREEAAVAAREQLNNRLMKEISREQTSWWKNELAKVREDVTQEAYTKKEYIATSVLQKGMLPDGTPSENIKLDRKEVIKLISKREDINMTEEDVTYAGLQADIQGIEEAIKSIEEFRDSIGKIKRSVTGFQETETRNIPKRYITTKISGRPIDELERQLGLGSIEEVAQKLIDTEKEYTRLTNDLKDRKDQLKTSAVEYKETLHGRVGQSLKRLPRGIFGENGLPLAMVSELFGYVNSEQLIDTLLNSPLINDYIDVQSLEIMKARHGELLTNKEMLKSEAMNAIHNDKRAELLRMELQHLASNNLPVLKDVIRRVARRMPNDTELQAWIKNVIADKKISDIRPKIYELAERKYANQAGKLLTQGKIDEAFDAKLKEYYNHELYKLASMAKEDVEDSLVKFNRFFKPDQQIGKTRDLNMVNAARSILARFGIGDSENTPDYYLETLKNYDEDLYRELNDLVGSATINAEDINSITYDEFTKVKNSVDSLWNLAKRSRQIVIDGKLMMRDEAIDQLNERFNKLSTKENLAGYKKDVTKWEKTKMYLLGLKASLRRVESWVTAMDGGNKGVFRSYIWNPIAESVYQYRGKKKEVMQKYLDVAKLIEKTITPDQIHSEELNYTFSNKASLLHALLHSGNESNLSKLLRGRGWGDAIMSGSLDTSKWDAFISRMWKEGKLTKADYDFCQGVWDLMDSIKVEAQQAHKDMYGYYFSEITANEIKTPWGNYRGGYVPAIADPLIVEKAAKQESIDLMSKSETSNMFPTTGRGFSKSRVEAYAKPLALNLGYIPSHIDKVLRFSYIEPRIKDVARIVKNSEFRDNLAKVDSEIGLSMIDPWLDRVASQRVDTLAKDKGARAIDYIFKEIRRRTGMQIMVGNVANTLQQFTGFALSMTKVKPHFFRNALWSYVRNPSKFVELISEKSEFMRTKEHGKMMEITSSLDDILLNPNAYDKARNFANKHGYFLQKATQDIVDNITWAAAYDQAISQNEIELEAVRSADSAVRETQGSFSPESVSRFETGSPFIRAFTMFYSYFNMQANLLDTEFTIIARDMGLKKGAGRALYVYTLGFMIPAVLSELIVRAVSGRLDDEDDDGYMNDFMDMFFGSQIRTAAAMVPFVGQLATVAMNKFNNKWYDDSISASPAVKMLESAVGAPQSIYKAITEDGNKKKAVKDSLMLLGMLSGLPLAAVGRPVGYAIDVTEGDKEPQNMIDYTRGLLTGK